MHELVTTETDFIDARFNYKTQTVTYPEVALKLLHETDMKKRKQSGFNFVLPDNGTLKS